VTASLVIMGVSGCGKSTLGRSLADALGRRFVEGDTLHPPANVAKMARGIPLEDADRWPFLEHVAAAITAAAAAPLVITCSALKRSYRDFLRARTGDLTFVLPLLDRKTLERRLAARHDHFMPSSLLDSQLATLELPWPDERAIRVDGTTPLPQQVAAVVAHLHRPGAGAGPATP
jgi:carbohydrate kinase (thermoresistant glucokinase family)